MLRLLTYLKRCAAFMIMFLIASCGGEDYSRGGELKEEEHIKGGISFPDGVNSELEFPVTIKPYYSAECPNPVPDPVFSDDYGNYSIALNCGSGYRVYLLYVSRSGNYALLSEIDNGYTQDAMEDSGSVELQPFIQWQFPVVIGEGFSGAYERADFEIGLRIENAMGENFQRISDIRTYDGNVVFSDHEQAVTESGSVLLSKLPVTYSSMVGVGNEGEDDYRESAASARYVVKSRLIGEYSNNGERVTGVLDSARIFFSVNGDVIRLNSYGKEHRYDDLRFIDTKEAFSTEGEYDELSEKYDLGEPSESGVYLRDLSSMPYRQDCYHLTLTFMDNLLVSLNNTPVQSGVRFDYDLSEMPVSDLTLDVTNSQTGETFTRYFRFPSEGLSTATDIDVNYSVASEITATAEGNLTFPATQQVVFVDYTADEVNLDITRSHPLQTVSVNDVDYGNEEEAGSATTSIAAPLSEGDNLFNLEVVAEDTNVVGLYTMNVYRSAADISDLLDLSFREHGNIENPAEFLTDFSPETNSYSFNYNVDTDTLVVMFQLLPATSLSVTLNGSWISTPINNDTFLVIMQEGLNTMVFTVTSADGTTSTDYTVEITHTSSGCSAEFPCTD
ncbi:MAG: hypothetical protein CMI13_02300 [Oleibacter sp.]|nr:hypothetical protein [Thalassolituus sp.]